MEHFDSGLNRNLADKAIRDEIDALTPRGWAKVSEKRLGELHALTLEMPAYHSRVTTQWQRRLSEEQIRATMRATWISAVSGLVGVVVGWLLSRFSS